MSIQSLMSAAHAAGFAMGVSEEFMAEDQPRNVVAAKALQLTERASRPVTGTALALAAPVHSRAQSIREWLVGWRAGATA